MTQAENQTTADRSAGIQILGMPDELDLLTADGLVEQGRADPGRPRIPQCRRVPGVRARLVLGTVWPGPDVPVSVMVVEGSPGTSAGSSPFRCLGTSHGRRGGRRDSNPRDQLGRPGALGITAGLQPTSQASITLFEDSAWSSKILEWIPLSTSR
jgi:hypothetical protein